MKSVGIGILLFVLSFSTLHDIFLSSIEKSSYVSNDFVQSNTTPQATQLSELHNLLHFIAIVDFTQISFTLSKYFSLLSEQPLPNTAPDRESSYKPPIV